MENGRLFGKVLFLSLTHLESLREKLTVAKIWVDPECS